MGITIRPAARADLIAIGDYIAADDRDRARAFVLAIEAAILTIPGRAASFTACGHLAPGLRVARHGRYRIFFRHDGDEVEVVRILHAVRDHAAQLSP